MDGVGASLGERLERLAFADLTADEVTGRILDMVAGWGREQGWRVYRRAASVLPLPPPNERRHSVVDVALARPSGPPIVVEVDRTDRPRTLEKLRAEAGAGRVAVWVRWGTGRLTPPAGPIEFVPLAVARRHGRFSRVPAGDRPAPAHSPALAGEAAPAAPAALDLGLDAGLDAGLGAGPDAGSDAGPGPAA